MSTILTTKVANKLDFYKNSLHYITMTNKEAASLITQAAIRWRQNALDRHDVQMYRSLAKVYRDDARDLKVVATLLRKNRVNEAAMAADDLDTLVRDIIPDAAWEHMQRLCRGSE